MHPFDTLPGRACRLGAFTAAIFASAVAGAAGAPQRAGQPAPAECPSSLPALYQQVSRTVVSISAISINPYDAEHRIDRVMGTGVIIDPSGLILSNSHVVFGRQVITVMLDDGTALPGRLIGADPTFDIALVRIPTPTKGVLPVAKLGDSSNLLVGEEVYAIGNPLGLDQTLTRGIVSAINRMLPGSGWSLTEPLIQTDAAINPGNSGGPLVDPCGLVVGVTTAILPDSQGIGFAVPINVVRDIAPQLVEKGRVVRAWLGVQGQFVPSQLKALLRLPLADGFLVEAIEPGSPAEQKGIQGGMFEITVDGEPVLLGGDIITAVNGGKLDAPEKLAAIMSEFRVGTALKLTVVREGKAQTIELSLGERPMQPWDLPARGMDTPGKTGQASTRRAPAARRTFVF